MEKKKEKKHRSLISYLIILLLFISLAWIYARYIGTTGITLREYNIIDENIPSSFDGFSIVQFSDLKLGSTFNTEDLQDLVDKINSLNPDIVVFTGDLVASNYTLSESETDALIEALSNIDPLIGKYSVRGDADVKGNLYETVMEASSFKDITNDYELIYYKGLTPIVLYGLDSLKGNQDFDATFAYPDEEDTLDNMATYRILLVHEPDTADLVKEYNISLMLSGHSHNSEINLPYLKELYNIEGASSYYDSEYKIGNMSLYISSGLGTSKYKVRLFSKPSISIFRLYND